MPSEETPWVVKGVPEFTRHTVKVYAAINRLTMGQTIQVLIARGIAAGIPATQEPAYGVLRDMPDKVLAELINRVAEEAERRRSMPLNDRMAEEVQRLRSIGLEQMEPSVQDIDVKKMFAEFLLGTEE